MPVAYVYPSLDFVSVKTQSFKYRISHLNKFLFFLAGFMRVYQVPKRTRWPHKTFPLLIRQQRTMAAMRPLIRPQKGCLSSISLQAAKPTVLFTTIIRETTAVKKRVRPRRPGRGQLCPRLSNRADGVRRAKGGIRAPRPLGPIRASG